ncbi:MAG: hypothetical protein ACQEV6_03580 [Pseudomonadota bacterium]
MIQTWLDRFDQPYPGGHRRVRVHASGGFLVVENLPLPDAHAPDYLDVLLLTEQFPERPPIGLYMLNKGNELLTAQIARRLNVFNNKAFHEAKAIPGYTWACLIYKDNSWRYNFSKANSGDNLTKFLEVFYALLKKEVA